MITTTEVKKIAGLAKLSFSEEKLSKLASELTNIMEMINVLNEVDCAGVEPLTSVCDQSQRLRKDVVTVTDISDELFVNVPGESAQFAKEIKCFIVPKVME